MHYPLLQYPLPEQSFGQGFVAYDIKKINRLITSYPKV